MREIEFRLMMKGKVVGYEKHEKGRIYHSKKENDKKFDILNLSVYYSPIAEREVSRHTRYIKHDRKDMYTGITLKDGTKVYERDIGLIDGHVSGDSTVTVIYSAPRFCVKHKDGTLYELNDYFYKVTGIAEGE